MYLQQNNHASSSGEKSVNNNTPNVATNIPDKQQLVQDVIAEIEHQKKVKEEKQRKEQREKYAEQFRKNADRYSASYSNSLLSYVYTTAKYNNRTKNDN